METADQIFVLTKQWLVSHSPEPVQWLVGMLLSVAPLMGLFALTFGITTVIERKALGRFQNRRGPNRVGIPFTKIRLAGFGQFMADGIKMLIKEDVVPHRADKIVHFLAPLALAIPVWLTFSVIPFGRNMAALDLNAGLLFFFAIGSSSELAVFMAGWSSRNKYALVGAMRGIAQMISYEIPLVLSTVTVVMTVGTLSLTQIVEAQNSYAFGLPKWFVFTPWGLVAFIIFLIAACAEANRAPFDLPEAESEIIAGYLTEYSGFKYALFFLGEYLGLFAISGMAVTLFLGGWTAPFSFLAGTPSWFWFFAKFATLIAIFIWVRATVPRLRMDQLMKLAWKFLVPLTFLNLLVAALWHYSAEWWQFPGALAARWLLGAAIIGGAYVALGRSLHTKQFPARTYRYAE